MLGTIVFAGQMRTIVNNELVSAVFIVSDTLQIDYSSLNIKKGVEKELFILRFKWYKGEIEDDDFYKVCSAKLTEGTDTEGDKVLYVDSESHFCIVSFARLLQLRAIFLLDIKTRLGTREIDIVKATEVDITPLGGLQVLTERLQAALITAKEKAKELFPDDGGIRDFIDETEVTDVVITTVHKVSGAREIFRVTSNATTTIPEGIGAFGAGSDWANKKMDTILYGHDSLGYDDATSILTSMQWKNLLNHAIKEALRWQRELLPRNIINGRLTGFIVYKGGKLRVDERSECVGSEDREIGRVEANGKGKSSTNIFSSIGPIPGSYI